MTIVVVTSSGLNLREIASTAGHTIDQLNRGDELSFIEDRTSISGVKWMRVHVLRTGDRGWVQASYTKAKPDKPAPRPPTAHHHPPLPPSQPPAPDFDVPLSTTWDTPITPPPPKNRWHWTWYVAVVLILVGVILLFRH